MPSVTPEYNGFLMTWNPANWDDQGWFDDAAERSSLRLPLDGTRWSSGGRIKDYFLGDRVFLLKQGAEPRGIVGSGWIDTETGVRADDHWDGSGRKTNYIDIDWEYFTDPRDPLPIAALKAAALNTSWRPQGSGTMISGDDLSVVEELWADHTGLDLPGPVGEPVDPSPSGRSQRPKSAGWQRDPELRRLVEDHAQAMLEKFYRDDGWAVVDTRYGNPFDAQASKGREVVYLEAKGTVGRGDAVLVTAGEVSFARQHPGECVMGVVSGIEFSGRKVAPGSGSLRRYEWDPDRGNLVPTAYRWTPDDESG